MVNKMLSGLTRRTVLLCAATTALASAAGLGQGRTMARRKPLVIAHRGASGLRPEHTLASYELAIEQGADFIEPDLVSTKDGVLVARHENEIGDTTDVARHAEFAARRATKPVDGAAVTGWFAEDFTLSELKTLRAIERLPQLRPANTRYDGRFDVPTLDEVIALAKRRSRETGRTIGIYPETKHPSHFVALGLALEPPLLAALKAAGWDRADAPVFIQSFEVGNLKRLKALTDVPLVQLIEAAGSPADRGAASYAAMSTPAGLAEVAGYAAGIGPAKALLWADAAASAASPLVADAHAAGLAVHPWTFRAENAFLPPRFRRGETPSARGDLAGELAAAIGLGIDGFFTDNPLDGVAARDAHRE